MLTSRSIELARPGDPRRAVDVPWSSLYQTAAQNVRPPSRAASAERLDPAMIAVAAAVEDHRLDTRPPWPARRAAGRPAWPRPCRRRSCSSPSAPCPGSTPPPGYGPPVVDDLGIDVLAGAEHRQPWPPVRRLPQGDSGCAARGAGNVHWVSAMATSSCLPCAEPPRRHSGHPCPCRARAGGSHGSRQRSVRPAVARPDDRRSRSAIRSRS